MARKNVVTMEPKAADSGGGTMPRSLEIASRGVKSSGHFSALMSALMSDLIDGRITPSVGNAVCNAGGKLLKVVEMQQRWGTAQTEGGPRELILSPQIEEPVSRPQTAKRG